jgi:hypothetical protein
MDPGFVRKASVVVPPGQTIYYCFDELTESTMYEFRAPPTSNEGTVLALFGDLGRGTTDDSDLWHEYG